MADIISINEKIQQCRNRKAALDRRAKIRVVQKMLQCTQCAYKCMKCGAHIHGDTPEDADWQPDPRVPYRFCRSCSEEYVAYVDKLQGGADPEAYWRNEAWLRIWDAWIAYQNAIDQFAGSREFKKLLEELRTPGPDGQED